MLGLPYQKWCETDWQLLTALDLYEESMCSCGRPRAVCQDPESEGHWQLVANTCYPQAAIDEFRRDHEKDELPDGLILGAHYVDDEATVMDPLEALILAGMRSIRERFPEAFSSGGGTGSQGSSEAHAGGDGSDVDEQRDGGQPDQGDQQSADGNA